jgi:6-phosphofructokinase 1
MKKIALLTSGGDAPGMNACIRAVVKSALYNDIEVLGIQDGFQGMMEERGSVMQYKDVDNIIYLGGTILGSSRAPEFKTELGREKGVSYLKKEGIEGLIIIGGDGSFAGAQVLSKESGIPVIGIPGTIDNDIFGTDYTIGYSTALETVVSAVDKLRDTATSHHRIFFVEVMGRDAGFIALNSAIASGAEEVLIPEEITDIPSLVSNLKSLNQGRRSSIVLVAEGDDAGGVTELVMKIKPMLPGIEFRVTILGHIQRGGSPAVYDRILATRLGKYAVESLVNGVRDIMVGVSGESLVSCPLTKSIKQHSQPDIDKLKLIRELRTKSSS